MIILKSIVDVTSLLYLILSAACRSEESRIRVPPSPLLSALKRWRALLEKRFDGLAMVLGQAGHNLPPRLAVEQLVELVIDRRVEIRLHIRIGNRRTVGDSRRDRMHLVAERRRRHDAICQSDSQGLVGADHVGQKI